MQDLFHGFFHGAPEKVSRAGVGLRLQWTPGWGVRLRDQSCGIRAAHYGTGLLQPSAPEPAASRQRESFPWKKMRTQSSQKEIPELPCQEPCSSRGMLTGSPPNQSSPGSLHPSTKRPGEGRAGGALDGLGRPGEDEPEGIGHRAGPCHAASPLKRFRGSFSAYSRPFRVIFHRPDSQLDCSPGMRCDNFLEAHVSDRCGVKVRRWRLRGCGGAKAGCEGLIPPAWAASWAGKGKAGQPLEAALKAGDPPGASCLHLHSLRAHPGCRPCSGPTREQGGGAGPGWAQQAGAGGHLKN